MPQLGHRSHAGPRLVAVILLIIALVGSAGACVSDAHAGSHHGGGSASVLCVGAPGGSLATVDHVRLPVIGQAVITAPAGLTLAPLDVLELPPKR